MLALSGLKIRATPSKEGKVLATLNYADQVIIQKDTAKQVPYKVEELKGFFIEGYWVKVVSNGKEGYVFDGFLSTWAAPERNLSHEELLKWDHLQEYRYFRRTLKSLSKAVLLSKCSDGYNGYGCKMAGIKGCSWEQEFSKDVHFESWEAPEKGNGTFIRIKSVTFREAYLLGMALYYDKDQKVVYDEKTKIMQILPIDEGAGCYIDIKTEKNGDFTFDQHCGC